MSMGADGDLAGASAGAAATTSHAHSELNEIEKEGPPAPHPTAVTRLQSLRCEEGPLASSPAVVAAAAADSAGCASEDAGGAETALSRAPQGPFTRCSASPLSRSSSGVSVHRTRSAVMSPNAQLATVSYLEAFHQKQRTQDTHDLRQRHQAFDSLKQWRGPSKLSGWRGGDTTAGVSVGEGAAARGLPGGAPGGPLRQTADRGSATAASKSRQQLVGEMAALFSRLCLGEEQRVLGVYRQKLARLQKQQLHLNALADRLIRSASATKARGTLIKERSFQLQRQLQQQEAAAKAPRKRIPALLRMPLPTLTPACATQKAQQQQQQPLDPWRRLLRRARPSRRRASLPSTVGLWGASSAPSAAAAAAAGAAAAAAAAAGADSVAASSVCTKVRERGRAGVPAAPVGAAAEPAAAAAAAAPAVAAAVSAAFELSEAVECFSSSRRRRSLPSRMVDPFFFLQRGGRMRRTAEELLQQAEAACAAAAAAGAAAPTLCRGPLLQDLHCLSRTLSVEMLQTQQRLQLAEMLQQRPAAAGRRGWEAAAARLCPLPLRHSFCAQEGPLGGPLGWPLGMHAEWGVSGMNACARSKDVSSKVPFHPPVASTAASIAAAAAEGSSGATSAAALAASVAADDCGAAAAEGSARQKSEAAAAGARAAAAGEAGAAASAAVAEAGAGSGGVWSEEDNSLLEAETDCEYLLGRQLLPYERMLLTYRMLKSKGLGVAAGAPGEAQLIEELLQAVGEGAPGGPGSASFPLGSEGLPADEEAQRWGPLWTEDADTDAAKVESLLLLVQQLQQADLQQLTHVARAIPSSSSKRHMQREETFLHAFFGEPSNSSEYSLDAPQGGAPEMRGAPAGDPTDAPRTGAPGGASLGAAKERKMEASTPGGDVETAKIATEAKAETGRERKTEKDADTETEKDSEQRKFPTAESLYRAHYLLGPWRSSLMGTPQQLQKNFNP
ncbi:hypothetical protein, conserved [Eimeria acervulina]|uniref:Uncharacterized protein n=1 Tax=Eimeria acervulina TaxID=5801 RepID=U6GHN2_EIMAC|nr:hypothetical protein, conserved [Eimeria acervulina]CDI79680.1 hypothetical protein, conserved [Eimeria acervulina]